MGQRRGYNETPLKRHVWRESKNIMGWECSCHRLEISSLLIANMPVMEVTSTWLVLDLITNIWENGVLDEFTG